MLEVKEIQTITEYKHQKELRRNMRKFCFGGNKEEMNIWIHQKRHAGKKGSCRLEADKEEPSEKETVLLGTAPGWVLGS